MSKNFFLVTLKGTDYLMMDSAHINEDEAAIYDRQIRLWGLDAQKRMRAADILVIGANGLTGETMKNIVLAGVNSVTLLDNTDVTDLHLSSMFLVSKDDVGKKVAEVSVAGLQRLNPLVKITADTDSLASKADEYFTKFHVVFMSNTSFPDLLKVNKICHLANVKFFAGSVFGFYGYMFADLGNHDYAEQVKVEKKTSETTEDGPPGAKRPRADSKPETETITVKKSCCFESLEDVLKVELKGLTRKQKKRIPNDYYIMRVLLDYCTENKSKPSFMDQENLRLQMSKTLAQLHVEEDLIDPGFVELTCQPELSAVCAIVGGITGQEILTAVSQQNAPINNYFFFNPERSAGYMETIHTDKFKPAASSAATEVSIVL